MVFVAALIIKFDEANSGIDNKLEAIVQKMYSLAKDRKVLVIAH